MRLTKSTSHAIRILIDCARASDGLIKVASLSARLEITPQNVFKIVNLLTKAKLIEAVRGRNGGVKLARPPQSIRIGDVVRATEVTHVEIEEGAPAGARSGRGVNRILDTALEAFIEVLDQHTIADMVKTTQSPTSLQPRRKPRTGARTASFVAGRGRRGGLHGGS
jgi:Rrf2 family nitric oxide-sensitive transcriptional repressor